MAVSQSSPKFGGSQIYITNLCLTLFFLFPKRKYGWMKCVYCMHQTFFPSISVFILFLILIHFRLNETQTMRSSLLQHPHACHTPPISLLVLQKQVAIPSSVEANLRLNVKIQHTFFHHFQFLLWKQWPGVNKILFEITWLWFLEKIARSSKHEALWQNMQNVEVVSRGCSNLTRSLLHSTFKFIHYIHTTNVFYITNLSISVSNHC